MAQVSLNNSRAFRFPRPAIFSMLLGFAGTVLAIEMGRTISMGEPADTTPIYPVLRALLAVLAVPCVAVAVGYFISFVQQRSRGLIEPRRGSDRDGRQSAGRERKSERSHLFAVANEQDVADQNRKAKTGRAPKPGGVPAHPQIPFRRSSRRSRSLG